MRLSSVVFVVAVYLPACGDDGSSTADAATEDAMIDGPDIDAAPPMLTLTSTAYANNTTIPLLHVCNARGGSNQSPPLAWGDVPAGTMSFAIVFTDLSTPQPFTHSVIYDIPATATDVPGNISRVYAPAEVTGAHQTNAYDGMRGYAGPCPGEMHTYEQAIYALPTATLTGATMTTNRTAATNLIKANNLGVAKLLGTHTPPI